MSTKQSAGMQMTHPSDTYPEFIIDERSGQVAVNLVETCSGQVIRHIPSSELTRLTRRAAPTADNDGMPV